MKMIDLVGRILLDTDIPVEMRAKLERYSRPGMIEKGNYIQCQRCMSKMLKSKVSLPNGSYYCPYCILLGRVSSDNKLYHLPENNLFQPLQKSPLTWQGTLSHFQKKCSDDLLQASVKPGEYLLWAVTGAGKTEMLFPTIERALMKHKRIALASPRVDGCNELYPRLCEAFAQISPALLHGRSNLPYRYSQLTICTTHQLLRFERAFDLLIIDEVDAFPFVNDKLLKSMAHRSLKLKGTLVYLTATPTGKQLARIRKKQLPVSYLPVRFHGHMLPVPSVQIESRGVCN